LFDKEGTNKWLRGARWERGETLNQNRLRIKTKKNYCWRNISIGLMGSRTQNGKKSPPKGYISIQGIGESREHSFFLESSN